MNSSERHHWHAAQAQVTCLKIACTNKNGNKHKTNIDRQATRDETCFIQNVLIFFSARAPGSQGFLFSHREFESKFEWIDFRFTKVFSVSVQCHCSVQFSVQFSVFECSASCCVLRVVCCVLVCVCVDGGLWIRRWCSPISTSRLVLVLVTRYKLSRVELSQVESLNCWSWSHRESLSRWVGLLSCWVVEVDRWSWSHRFSAEMKT